MGIADKLAKSAFKYQNVKTLRDSFVHVLVVPNTIAFLLGKKKMFPDTAGKKPPFSDFPENVRARDVFMDQWTSHTYYVPEQNSVIIYLNSA